MILESEKEIDAFRYIYDTISDAQRYGKLNIDMSIVEWLKEQVE